MPVLNGWKEIAHCLHMSPRNARRWEQLGLPVRRVSDSCRSPVVAFSEEIEDWLRAKGRVGNVDDYLNNLTKTQRKTKNIANVATELKAAISEYRRLLTSIRSQIAISHESQLTCQPKAVSPTPVDTKSWD
jgi:hypothetical protein